MSTHAWIVYDESITTKKYAFPIRVNKNQLVLIELTNIGPHNCEVQTRNVNQPFPAGETMVVQIAGKDDITDDHITIEFKAEDDKYAAGTWEILG